MTDLLRRITRPVRSSVFVQGCLLAVVSVIVQICFYLGYNNLLERTNMLAHRESQSKSILGRTNWLSTILLVEVSNTLLHAGTGKAVPKSENDYTDEQLKAQMNELDELTLGNEGVRKNWVSLMQDCATVHEWLVERRNDGRALTQQERDKLRQLIISASDRRGDFLVAARVSSPLSPDWLPRARKDMGNWLTIGFILNVSFTLIAFVFFFLLVTKRLWLINRNITAYGKGETLSFALKGNDDEIDLIDGSFRSMARSLDELAVKRRELMSMVSHDLRSPLTNIVMCLDLWKNGAFGETPARLSPELERIDRNSKRLLRLVNDLLDMEKLEAGKLEVTISDSLAAKIVSEAIDAVKDIAAHADVILMAPETGDDLRVMADSERILQILINLLSNAIKFSPKHGTVAIDLNKQGDTVVFSVSDQGRGIPDELKTKVFDRFEQVNQADAKVGTGLGLAICKELVALQGGKIWVEDAQGGGSKFFFALPESA